MKDFEKGHKNFSNGYDHNQSSLKGVSRKFAVVENGDHQRDEDGAKSKFDVLFDQRYLEEDSLTPEKVDEKLRVLDKAQRALEKARKTRKK